MPCDPRTEDVALRGDLVAGPTGEGWSPRRRTQRSRAAPSDPPRRQSAPARMGDRVLRPHENSYFHDDPTPRRKALDIIGDTAA
jgi:hypothetical protein